MHMYTLNRVNMTVLLGLLLRQTSDTSVRSVSVHSFFRHIHSRLKMVETILYRRKRFSASNGKWRC